MNKAILDRKADILAEVPNVYLGTCLSFDVEYAQDAAILQVTGIDVEDDPNFKHDLFTEDEMHEALEAAGVQECAGCEWWCDDVYYSSKDFDGDICSCCFEAEL